MFAAPRQSTDVTIRVAGIAARATVRQTFRNPHDEWFEGIYVFPLPENAAVDQMKMRIGERDVQGVIKEKAAAKAAYEEAKAGGQRAALLEQERPNLFTSSVANIGPREEITVELEYQQTLRFDNGRFSLRFPTAITPRYIPGNVQVAGLVSVRPIASTSSSSTPTRRRCSGTRKWPRARTLPRRCAGFNTCARGAARKWRLRSISP